MALKPLPAGEGEERVLRAGAERKHDRPVDPELVHAAQQLILIHRRLAAGGAAAEVGVNVYYRMSLRIHPAPPGRSDAAMRARLAEPALAGCAGSSPRGSRGRA